MNTLATLSVVFAFLLAPVGAILGHFALRDIRRRGDRGRNRALVGLTLSYAFTVIAVVALVLWASPAPITVPNRRRILRDPIRQLRRSRLRPRRRNLW